MTLPYEQVYAIKNAHRFLQELVSGNLLTGRMTALMKGEIRKRAYRCLKHFPADIEVDSYWMGGKWNSGKWPPLLSKKEKP